MKNKFVLVAGLALTLCHLGDAALSASELLSGEFPLWVGRRAEYNVTLEFADAGDPTRPRRWQGRVTETIDSFEKRDGALIFRATARGVPSIDGPSVIVEDVARRYIVNGGRVSGVGFFWNETLVFPLRVGRRWVEDGDEEALRRADGWYVWRVEGKEDITTAGGKFAGCYRVAFRSNPDHVIIWFCPGVGVVREEYVHHGSLNNQRWDLLSAR